MRKIDALRELQTLDTALDRAKLELESRKVKLGDDSELVPLREAVESMKSRLKTLRDRGKELDEDLEDWGSKRKRDEAKLYSGTVKNPKDLSALASEVELEKSKIGGIEDKALANMDAMEEASAAFADASKVYAERESAWKAEQELLTREAESLAAQLADLSSKRQALAEGVDATTIRSYESLRRSRGGLAVAPIEQRSCQGCRIALSSSEFQRARTSTDLVTCHSCGRILYFVN